MRSLARILKMLAAKSHRTPEENLGRHRTWGVYAKYVLIAGFMACFYLLFYPVFLQRSAEWGEARPSVKFPKEIWRVYFGRGSEPCGLDARTEPGCPANPSFSKLWASELRRSDKAHLERVRKAQGREFWISASVPGELIAEAAKTQSKFVLLGWVRATYRVWVDGKFVLGGDGTLSEPLMLELPLERLRSREPLRIAIQFFHLSGHPAPDFLNSGPDGEGFLSYSKAASHRTYRAFVSMARPFSLFLANALLASIFFFFWISAKIKREYYYMSAYATVAGLYQVRLINFIFLKLSPNVNFFVENALIFFEGAFAMFLGLAFARTRSVAFRWGIPVTLAAPALISLALSDATASFLFNEWLAGKLVPVMCMVGAVACGVQAYYLYAGRQSSAYLPVRIRRLLLFSLGLTAIAFLYWLQSSSIASLVNHGYFHRFGHFVLVCFLGFVVFKDYKEQGLLVEKAPVSEYHRRPVLPAKLSGAILVADLKSSEPFYKYRAMHGEASDVVSAWRAHFYTAILRYGGIVIQKKGDEVIGFFDADKCPSPLESALRAVDEVAVLSELLEREYRSRGSYPPDGGPLNFRASLVEGEIRPVWENVNDSREAYWEEAGTTTPFVDSSRLLDLERKIEGDAAATRLVLRETCAAGLAAADAKLADSFVVRDRKVQGKHGADYQVAVYLPRDTAKETSSKKAA